MNKDIEKPKPIYFSDYFKVDKAKLKELGVFDPILNHDTKLFVDPTLLKSSENPIIKNSRNNYANFFVNLLKLLQRSQQVDDKCWRAAKRLVHFPEFKYTCIGYGSDSINGSGSGAELNDKIFQSALDIVQSAEGDPDIFLLLPLLEEGIGADRISDMTQNIIDEDICKYTVSMMLTLGVEGNCTYKTKQQSEYRLIKNPYSNCPLKLVPSDILANLPLSETFDKWLVEESERNSTLRDKINNEIGWEWFEANKTDKKESLLKKLKEDKAFFLDVLKALKDSSFDHYDLDQDVHGLHRWLEDSQQFLDKAIPTQLGNVPDALEGLKNAVDSIINQFKASIERDGLKGLFWTKIGASYKHVKETYTQMLFSMVCRTWLTAQDSNLKFDYGTNAQTKQFTFSFTISGLNQYLVQIKHADNYRGLQDSFEKHVKHIQTLPNTQGAVMVFNFDQDDSNQLAEIKKMRYADCELIEIYTQRDEKRDHFGHDDFLNDLKLDLSDFTIEFADLDWSFDENYKEEKRRGGQKRHRQTTEVKEELVTPMFSNRALIKGQSVKQRAEKINDELAQIPTMSESEIEQFSKKFGVKLLALKNAASYFESERKDQVYKWCLIVQKGTNEHQK
jgi:hypothetical protein